MQLENSPGWGLISWQMPRPWKYENCTGEVLFGESRHFERYSLLFTLISCVFNIDYSFKFTKRSIIKSNRYLCSLNAKCIFYLPRRFLWSFDWWFSSNICFYKTLENFLNLENSPLKISTSLSSPSRTSHCNSKSISFSTKASTAKK